MSTTGPVLYARSRALPQTVAALAATTLLAVWAAHALDSYLDPERRVPVVALAPLVAATAIGTSLHFYVGNFGINRKCCVSRKSPGRGCPGK